MPPCFVFNRPLPALLLQKILQFPVPFDLPIYPKESVKSATASEDFALRPGNELEQIEAALAKARGNKTVAARLLQIDRKTLYNKMHQLGLEL